MGRTLFVPTDNARRDEEYKENSCPQTHSPTKPPNNLQTAQKF